ncbi:mucolipin-3-like isoform X2 [Ischnura elegans]|uniref:mucolipin-3-like isoform X2 n=1 Tax=Ischnura elegans TaxID=197161 RepID=UPI001ED8A6BF|nr:mucolipin-3-like isoform X2 [Ischnura elegans]
MENLPDTEHNQDEPYDGPSNVNHSAAVCEPSVPLSGYGAATTEKTEDKMRRKLKFFFMNPIEKWRVTRRLPYKLIVQVIKIAFVTLQLCLFASSRYNHVNYTSDNRVAFSHLFLRGWDASREVEGYPPAVGPLALYEIDEFYETIDYALNGYAHLDNAIGPYYYPNEDNEISLPVLCLYEYKEGIIYGFNESYVFNNEIIKTCHDVPVSISSQISSATLLGKINFSALVRASLTFAVKTVNLKAAGPLTPPDCYRFDIEISFDNRDHDGQMLVTLEADAIRLSCKGSVEYITEYKLDSVLRSLLNYLVMCVCLVSLVLCSRAIYRAHLLKKETVQFFERAFGKSLSMKGRLEFLNFWYVMIITNDVLIIIGSGIKERIERKQFVGDQWNVCSVLLGTGNLLVWFGLLRYLGFFKTYNVLILTLKKAAPKVARFLLCALILYSGYTFCGWLVLGPYHLKFRSLSSTSECLFSLINGDDMFATFFSMSKKSPMLWWFSRLYLYSFISLFIYVVLSLFISVIMDAYETIKMCYQQGFPKSDLQEFISSGDEETSPGILPNERSPSLLGFFPHSCCGHRATAAETEPLIT